VKRDFFCEVGRDGERSDGGMVGVVCVQKRNEGFIFSFMRTAVDEPRVAGRACEWRRAQVFLLVFLVVVVVFSISLSLHPPFPS
jgi:hypothetical protein